MKGTIKIELHEIDKECTSIGIHSEVANVNAEEAIAVCYGLSESLKLTDDATCAGLLAMCILCNKVPSEIIDSLGDETTFIVSGALHECLNEMVGEFTERNAKAESKRSTISALLRELFKD